MTCAERVGVALGHGEPDRVPYFLTTTMHGAQEVGVSLSEYFATPKLVVEGQLRMQRRYRSDFLYGVLYAALEIEAFGGEVVNRTDGPTNAGRPILPEPAAIDSLEPPDVASCPALQRALEVISGLAAAANGKIPVVGSVVSPFSLPIMQMGFEGYLRLMWLDEDRFWTLMAVNEEFSVAWANAQLDAGATALGYFDPVASPTITAPAVYRRTGKVIAGRTLARIAGPTATHLASGRCLPVIDDIASTGTAMVGVSALEDLAQIKARCAGKLVVAGNLNGIEMRRWTPDEAEAAVKRAIAAGGPEGGFVLADNHGEIPLQVPVETLDAITAAVDRWGHYPLDWVDEEVR
jgi:uroporphyrinogen decarboxylase